MCCQNPTSKNNAIARWPSGAAIGASVLALCLSAATASAQFEGILEEITVTAQKREQTLQDVPASVSAISGETVNDYLGSAENIRALAARVPSLNIESSNGRTQPRFYIRGLGNIDFDNNANQPVAMVYDEIALENNVLRSLPLYDIERVEVLKGPQGSLFGRNTNAGIIKIDSVRPTDEPNGYFKAGLGIRNTINAEIAAGGGLTDTLSARLSLKYQDRDDWIDNIANGPGDDYGSFDEFAYRLQFLWEPSDDFTGLLKLHGFDQGGSQPQVFYANAIQAGSEGLRPGFDEEIANQDGGAGMDLDHQGAALNLQWNLDNDLTFTSITGWDSVENFQFTDVDGGLISFDINDIGELGRQVFFNVHTGDGLDGHRQFTQEFRLAQQRDELFYQLGFYYFDEQIDVLTRDFNANSSEVVNQETQSVAVFGQLEYAFTDVFALTVGLRYTDDQKDLEVIPLLNSSAPADTISVDDDYVSWDVAFTYDISDDWSWYGRVANASRGPVTLGRFGFTSSADTETSTSIEAGFKSDLFGGRGRWNASVYAFQNDDQQLSATGGGANVNRLLNADQVNGFGFETDFEVLLTDNLLLISNLSYNDTEIDDPNLSDLACGSSPPCTKLDPIIAVGAGPFGEDVVSIDGNPLPRTPEWIFNLIAQWTVPLSSGNELYFNTDWNYRGDSNLFLHESVEFVAEERILGSVRFGWRDEDRTHDVAVVGRNITDEITVDGGINFLNLTAFINEPAFWGVEYRLNW